LAINQNSMPTITQPTPPPQLNGHVPKKEVVIRSEAMQEIIDRKLDFMDKWAVIIFLTGLCLLFASTWFIHSPNTVEASAYLTASDAPKEIFSRQEGRLIRLWGHNDDTVAAGQVIGWIESTADHASVADLSIRLDSSLRLLADGRTNKVSKLFEKHYNHLGELQTAYQTFITALQVYNDYLVNGFYNHKKQLLKNDISSLQQINTSLLNQEKMTNEDIQLAEESFNMNNSLLNEKVLSREDLRQAKSKLVNKRLLLPQLKTTMLANEIQQREKQNEIDMLEHDLTQQNIIFQQSLQTFRSTIEDWEMKYVIKSPIDGVLSFVVPLQDKQFLQAGKLLGYVNPKGTQYYAQLNLPQNNFGEIDTGLQVQLRFYAYPYQEFGFVPGTLNYVSKVATDSGFIATIRLNNGLETNHHIRMQYKTGLKAKAVVITRNMRLPQRLYFSIAKAIRP